MTPIISSDATLRLLGCFLSFATDRASVERSLAVAVQLCAEVRSVEASLTRTAPTATVFRKLAPHLGPEVTRKVPPANAREMISEFRALLRKQRSYAFRPKGAAGGPGSRAATSLAVQTLGLGAIARAGRRPPVLDPGADARRGRPRLPPRCPRERRARRPRLVSRRVARPRRAPGSPATARHGRCRAGSAIWRAASARWSRSPC